MDKAAWITIITYFILLFLLNFENVVLKIYKDAEEYFYDIYTLITFIGYVLNAYFIFVMKDVYNKLTCETEKEFGKIKRRDKVIKMLINTLFVLYFLTLSSNFIMNS
jgi:amino acid transporter